MADISVDVFDPYICDGCPAFDVSSSALYSDGEVYGRYYYCSNLSLCSQVVPQVKRKVEALSVRNGGGENA